MSYYTAIQTNTYGWNKQNNVTGLFRTDDPSVNPDMVHKGSYSTYNHKFYEGREVSYNPIGVLNTVQTGPYIPESTPALYAEERDGKGNSINEKYANDTLGKGHTVTLVQKIGADKYFVQVFDQAWQQALTGTLWKVSTKITNESGINYNTYFDPWNAEYTNMPIYDYISGFKARTGMDDTIINSNLDKTTVNITTTSTLNITKNLSYEKDLLKLFVENNFNTKNIINDFYTKTNTPEITITNNELCFNTSSMNMANDYQATQKLLNAGISANNIIDTTVDKVLFVGIVNGSNVGVFADGSYFMTPV